MRHRNAVSNSMFHGRGKKITVPYQTQYIESYSNNKFKNAKAKNRYVEIIQDIADHPGSKRVDVQKRVWRLPKVLTYTILRGYASSIFSQLLYLDLIDYDKNFKYCVTDKGREVLKNSYLNEMEKIVKGK